MFRELAAANPLASPVANCCDTPAATEPTQHSVVLGPVDGSSVTPSISAKQWTILWLVALGVRLPGVWLIANAHGDAYSYVETITAMAAKLSSHSFGAADLFGFWLPLYQFASALLVMATGLSSLIAGKMVSALCGAATAILVFDLTIKLTRSRGWASIAFLLLLSEPGQIFLSALSMTEAPNIFLSLAVVRYAALGRWNAAAIAAALAGWVRIDSWIFLPLLPALQYWRERKVSVLAVLVLLTPPAGWLFISYAARGYAFAYFAERATYVEAYLEFEPVRRGFALISQDALCLLAGAHAVIFPLAIIGVALFCAGFRGTHRSTEIEITGFALAITFSGMLGFLILAYCTRSQPVIWVRYGAIFLVLGVPLAASCLQKAARAWNARTRLRWMGAALLIASCVAHAVWQSSASLLPAIMDDLAHQRVADDLRRVAVQEGWNVPPASDEKVPWRCFCDDPAVRVLSGLPASRFLRTEGNESVSSLTAFLNEHGVRYVVFTAIEHSLLAKLSPTLGRPGAAWPFHLVSLERSPRDYGPHVWFYRVASQEAPGDEPLKLSSVPSQNL